MKKTLFTTAMLSIFTLGYSQYGVTQYRDPARIDMSSSINAATILQNRHNSNVRRVQNTMDNIFRELERKSQSDDEKNHLDYLFTEKCIKKMPNIQYSSDSQTDNIIRFLYDCINYEMKNN
ncbi:MAG: hypothetical protein ACOH1X_00935 [Kaistella sp.]